MGKLHNHWLGQLSAAIGIHGLLLVTLTSDNNRGRYMLAEIKDRLFRKANPAALELVHSVGGAG